MMKVFSLFLLFFLSCKAEAQTDISQESENLYNEIAQTDSIFFEAFNNKDMEKMKAFVSADIEFYHDKSGLTHYEEFIKELGENFKNNNDVRRELAPGSLEVYQVKDYGAIEIGKHKFCRAPYNDENCGIYKFVHVWKKENDGWKLTRVISYDH